MRISLFQFLEDFVAIVNIPRRHLVFQAYVAGVQVGGSDANGAVGSVFSRVSIEVVIKFSVDRLTGQHERKDGGWSGRRTAFVGTDDPVVIEIPGLVTS